MVRSARGHRPRYPHCHAARPQGPPGALPERLRRRPERARPVPRARDPQVEHRDVARSPAHGAGAGRPPARQAGRAEERPAEDHLRDRADRPRPHRRRATSDGHPGDGAQARRQHAVPDGVRAEQPHLLPLGGRRHLVPGDVGDRAVQRDAPRPGRGGQARRGRACRHRRGRRRRATGTAGDPGRDRADGADRHRGPAAVLPHRRDRPALHEQHGERRRARRRDAEELRAALGPLVRGQRRGRTVELRRRERAAAELREDPLHVGRRAPADVGRRHPGGQRGRPRRRDPADGRDLARRDDRGRVRRQAQVRRRRGDEAPVRRQHRVPGAQAGQRLLLRRRRRLVPRDLGDRAVEGGDRGAG